MLHDGVVPDATWYMLHDGQVWDPATLAGWVDDVGDGRSPNPDTQGTSPGMSRWQARETGSARVAIVGRPNVGKSTLVNRIAGRRDAIVQEMPGVTRDRSTHAAEWIGRSFTLIDTGGWTPGWAPDRTTMDELVSLQAEAATREADLVLFVVDAAVGITSEDEAVAKWLRASGMPVMLIANKADTLNDTEKASVLGELYALGVGDPTTMSALHGHGSGDLLDDVVGRLRRMGAFDRPDDVDDGIPGIALIGRPNVGKSSLFNRLVGQDRVIVDDVPGTTRDPVDTLLEFEGDDGETRTYRFIDTAGLRKNKSKLDTTEFYSTVRTRKSLDRAAVALLMLDSGQTIGEQEQRLAREIIDSGRAVVLVQNKWDLVDEERRFAIAKERDRLLQFLDFAPMRRISALTGSKRRQVVHRHRPGPRRLELPGADGAPERLAVRCPCRDATAARPQPPSGQDQVRHTGRHPARHGSSCSHNQRLETAPTSATWSGAYANAFPFEGTPIRLGRCGSGRTGRTATRPDAGYSFGRVPASAPSSTLASGQPSVPVHCRRGLLSSAVSEAAKVTPPCVSTAEVATSVRTKGRPGANSCVKYCWNPAVMSRDSVPVDSNSAVAIGVWVARRSPSSAWLSTTPAGLSMVEAYTPTSVADATSVAVRLRVINAMQDGSPAGMSKAMTVESAASSERMSAG